MKLFFILFALIQINISFSQLDTNKVIKLSKKGTEKIVYATVGTKVEIQNFNQNTIAITGLIQTIIDTSLTVNNQTILIKDIFYLRMQYTPKRIFGKGLMFFGIYEIIGGTLITIVGQSINTTDGTTLENSFAQFGKTVLTVVGITSIGIGTFLTYKGNKVSTSGHKFRIEKWTFSSITTN